jgi:hypothetical protein
MNYMRFMPIHVCDPQRGAPLGASTQCSKKTLAIAVGAGLALLTGCGGSSTDDAAAAAGKSAPTATVTAEPTSTPTVTVTETVTPKPKPKLQPAEMQAAAEVSDDDTPYVMPDEVGKSLQGAQDDLQEVSGNPLFVSFSEDATGQGRVQVLDSGWQVCSQMPKAGEAFGDYTDVKFYVVRESENCP